MYLKEKIQVTQTKSSFFVLYKYQWFLVNNINKDNSSTSIYICTVNPNSEFVFNWNSQRGVGIISIYQKINKIYEDLPHIVSCNRHMFTPRECRCFNMQTL